MKKNKRRWAVALLVSCMLLLFTACDDYAKEESAETVSVALEAEPTSVAGLTPELDELVKDYDEEGVLTQVTAVFTGNDQVNAQKGTLYYTYCSSDEESGRATIVILTYDMATQTVIEVKTESGNGAFVDESSEPIEPSIIGATFESLFEAMKNDPTMSPKFGGENIEVTMTFDSKRVEMTLI